MKSSDSDSEAGKGGGEFGIALFLWTKIGDYAMSRPEGVERVKTYLMPLVFVSCTACALQVFDLTKLFP